MDIPFTSHIRTKFSFFNSEKLKTLLRPALLSVLLAFLGGGLLHLVHHQEGAHELIEISPVMHWLRDSSLALPLIFLAAWPAMRLIRRQVEQRDWKTRPWLTALVEMAAIALLASAFITALNAR